MKLDSYWTDSAPAFAPAAHALPAQVDVAIVGGGFTGLSAALALAKRGARVAVLEAGTRVAAEASGRNGGHVNNGLAVDYADVAAKVGIEKARAWYRAYDDAVDTVARLVRDEAIDCDFMRHGKLKLATRANQMAALENSARRLIGDGVDTERHAATIWAGEVGVLHGARTYVLQDEDGQTVESHSISAGLDYPGVGPQHAALAASGRATYLPVTDAEAMEAMSLLARTEGIIPAIESAHAVAGTLQLAKQRPGETLLVNLSGRGDKDMGTALDYFKLGQPDAETGDAP